MIRSRILLKAGFGLASGSGETVSSAEAFAGTADQASSGRGSVKLSTGLRKTGTISTATAGGGLPVETGDFAPHTGIIASATLT
jgi:hypothetical protein